MESGFSLAGFGGAFIGGKRYRAADGRRRHGGAGYLSWFVPQNARRLSITCVHGGGGQSTDFLTTPDGRPGWVHAFLAQGYPVFLLDRPGHGRARWNVDILGPRLPAADYDAMSARFMHPAQSNSWPEAAAHSQWPDGSGVDDAFMASQDGMAASLAAAQFHAESIAEALFSRTGPTVLLTHSAGGPCGWAIAAFGGANLRAIVACEPLGAPGMEHPLGRFEYGITAAPLTGTDNPFRAPIAVLTAQASWMRESNAQLVAWLKVSGANVDHLKLEEHGIQGNGHMMMLEKNSASVAKLVLDWISRKVADQ